jgi:hypothetical protein
MGHKKKKTMQLPFVSVCTPTFNRRPFVPMMLQCFDHQTYPKDRMEWLIVDDGTDKIEDLLAGHPQIRYFSYGQKMTLGQKRNLLNENARGDILVYMDDDDYYPPERVRHAVERLLSHPAALCAGSSAMFIYFKHIQKMFQFGPYGPNHATAATFAFRRELLAQTAFDPASSVAEEKKFLKDYTIPFVQLDPVKSILVVSHNHNSFDKKELLKHGPNPNIHETALTPANIIREPALLRFFMEEVDPLLANYRAGEIQHKPDVMKQIAEIKQRREQAMQEQQHRQQMQEEYQRHMQGRPSTLNVEQVLQENQQLREKVQYLEAKIREIIGEKIKEIKSSPSFT